LKNFFDGINGILQDQGFLVLSSEFVVRRKRSFAELMDSSLGPEGHPLGMTGGEFAGRVAERGCVGGAQLDEVIC